MKLSFLVAAAGLALAAPVAAQSPLNHNPPTEAVICVEPRGLIVPAVCRGQASRLEQRDDICICHQGVQVRAPVCAAGEQPPGESAALIRARGVAARDGTLVGDLFQGRPMCIRPRNFR